MRQVAGFALTTASAFLGVVAIMLNSPALFYMATALIASIGACHLQALWATKGLRFDRVAPDSVRVGDLVTVEIFVWSERKIRRPLVTIYDNLPPRLLLSHRSPSLPVAPAYDLPIRTQYQFRPQKRGRYRWSGLTVESADALGLITKRRGYETTVAEMTVLPTPIPVTLELPAAAGWGISEAESGQARGAGLEPRGVREYVSGDALRHVHWRSTARTGKLLVKEFEAGTHASAALLIQDQRGTDIGTGATTSLELICGHAAYLSDVFLRQGAKVEFPGIEAGPSRSGPGERIHEIYDLLAGIQAVDETTLGQQATSALDRLSPGSMLLAMIAVRDDSIFDAVAVLHSRGVQVVALLYDANQFLGPKEKPVASAADPDFVERLQSAGAHPVIMPIPVQEGKKKR